MTIMTCPVDGCMKNVHRAGYCYGHYMKNWRYGTPTPNHGPRWVDLSGQRFGSLVVLRRTGTQWDCRCDCGRTTTVRTGDLNRGSAISCGDKRDHHRSDNAGYHAAHDRVRRDRGRAQEHQCVGCGSPAQQWSYTHAGQDERLAYGISKNPIAYSLDPQDYVARCISCHKRFDLSRSNSTVSLLDRLAA